MKNEKLTTAIGKEGLGEQSWWVEQWMQLINTYRFKKRLERAWIYAREGNVSSIRFEGRRVHARVQGTEKDPYKVKLWLDILDDEDWAYVIEALAKKAKWSALLLAGTMPKDIEKAFATTGKRLFPFNLQEVKSECSCPDKANPCKHISAIYYLMGDQFKEDPFILFQLRGRDKNTLLSNLIKKRSLLNQTELQNNYIRNNKKTSDSKSLKRDPELWWSYQETLDDDLVVITPLTEETLETFTTEEFPLAQNPKFPNSHNTFIKNLISHGQTKAQQAMIKAMSIQN
ncbi:SWIM zinc finger family protein [Prochlorococcus marinus]|uniref:SWIM zinc finger family protein n=1 Tax=Prochlorococcus marinus TaxID=1219 RepID=UPI0022B5E4B2|nr:SWIM zinc finger family protein [Prochlorococcus marinus]